jgi:hypothetical protein
MRPRRRSPRPAAREPRLGTAGWLLVGGMGSLAGSARAARLDTYGFDAVTLGLAGSGLAKPNGPGDVFTNPASLVAMSGLQASVGYGFYRSEFDPWPELYWDTNVDGRIDDTDVGLDVQPDVSRDDGLSFAIGRPIGERFGLAVAGFLPRDRMLGIHTFDASMPNYFLYENRMDRFELAVGFGWEQLPGLRVGGAVQIIAKARYSIDVTLDLDVRGAAEGDDELQDLVIEATIDAHEMSLDIVPGFAPVASLQWDVGELVPALDGLELGAAWRGSSGLPVDVAVDVQINATASDLGDLEPLSFALALPLELSVFDHYLPARLSLAGTWTFGDVLSASADAHWTGWELMQVNVARFASTSIQSPMVDLSDVEIADANGYSIELKSTWSGRTGVELLLPATKWPSAVGGLQPAVRGGWGLDPSPLVQQGPGSAFLDSDRMIFALGAGIAHEDPFALAQGLVRWDVWGQLHVLASGELVRPDSPYSAGYPVGGQNIPIGGRLKAAGLQWSSEF